MRLVHLVAPPRTPTAASGDFARVEAELGTPLPADYKELVRLYGYGTFCDFLHVWSPFFEPFTMIAGAREALSADRELQRAAPGAVPFALFPQPGGALPWARSDNGDVVYWLTNGRPDEWPVAVWYARSGRKSADVVEGGAVAFLGGWITGQIDVAGFEKPERPIFDRYLERAHETILIAGPAGAYEERFQSLVAELAPIEMRGGFHAQGGRRQAHFVCAEGDVRVTYDTLYGHNVRLGAPAAVIDEVRARIERAVVAMGCSVARVIRH